MAYQEYKEIAENKTEVYLTELETKWNREEKQKIKACKNLEELKALKIFCMRHYRMFAIQNNLSELEDSKEPTMSFVRIQRGDLQKIKIEGQSVKEVKSFCFDFACNLCNSKKSVFIDTNALNSDLLKEIQGIL